MRKEISSVISFLTIIPSKNVDLDIVAKNMHLFPIGAAIIGLIIGSIGFGLSLYLAPLITGLLLTGSVMIITGMHHTDALGDFADGIMAKGREQKLKAIRDPAVGAAGVVAIVLYAGGMIIGFSTMQGFVLFKAILSSELVAKFAMVLQANRGMSAWEGQNSFFTKYMKDKRKVGLAFLMTIVPVILIGELAGAIALGIGIVLSLILVAVAKRSFGGVSGDVFGATNELTRLSSLLVFASV